MFGAVEQLRKPLLEFRKTFSSTWLGPVIRNPGDCLGAWRIPAPDRVCQGGRPWFGSTAMAHIVGHLSLRQLEARYRASHDATEARHLQAIWLLAQGRTVPEVAEVLASVPRWVEQLAARYNASGPAALGDRRRGKIGRASCRVRV